MIKIKYTNQMCIEIIWFRVENENNMKPTEPNTSEQVHQRNQLLRRKGNNQAYISFGFLVIWFIFCHFFVFVIER